MDIAVNAPIKKIDIGKALDLKYNNGVKEADIARLFNVSAPAISQALKPFRELMQDSKAIDFVSDNYKNVVKRVNSRLLLELVNEKKLKEASLNNTAYALGVVSKELRLEQGKATDNHDIIIKDLNSIKSQALALADKLHSSTVIHNKTDK